MPSEVQASATLRLSKGQNRVVFRNPRGNKRYYAFHDSTAAAFAYEWSSDGQDWSNSPIGILDPGGEGDRAVCFDVKIRDDGSQLVVYLVWWNDDASGKNIRYVRGTIADSSDTISWATSQTIKASPGDELTDSHCISITRTDNGRHVVAFTEDVHDKSKSYRQTKLIGSDGDGATPNWSGETVWDDPSQASNNDGKGDVWFGLESFGSTQANRVLLVAKIPDAGSTNAYAAVSAVPDWDGSSFTNTAQATIDTNNSSGPPGDVISGLVDGDGRAHCAYRARGTEELKSVRAATAGDDDWQPPVTVKNFGSGIPDAITLALDTGPATDELYAFYHDSADSQDFLYKKTPVDTISWGTEQTITFASDLIALTSWNRDVEGSLHIGIEDADTDVHYHEFAVAAGQTIGVGQAVETDTSRPFSAVKEKAIGQVVEADLAQPITAPVVVVVNQALEADTSHPVSWAPKHRLVGQNTESDIVQALSATKRQAIGRALEADTAQSITAIKAVALNQATEANTSQSVTSAKLADIAQVLESDAARAITSQKVGTADQALETDASLPVGSAKARSITRVAETDTAQVLAEDPKSRLVGQAVEADLGQALSSLKQQAIAQALETQLSQAVTALKATALARVAESDLAQAITVAGEIVVTVAQALEANTAGATTSIKTLIANQVSEADLARAVAAAKTAAVNLTSESDLGQAITRLKTLSLGLASASGIAQPITTPSEKVVPVGLATETQSSQPIASIRTVALTQATEANLAQAISATKVLLVGFGTETDAAAAITVEKPLVAVVGLIAETDTSRPITSIKTIAFGGATEAQIAQAIAIFKVRNLGLATETNLANVISWAPKHRLLGRITETDLAQSITHLVPVIMAQLAISDEASFEVAVTDVSLVELSISDAELYHLTVLDSGDTSA